MKLVEVIATWVDRRCDRMCKIYGFLLDQRLGKGVVGAKDRPNFIGEPDRHIRHDGNRPRK